VLSTSAGAFGGKHGVFFNGAGGKRDSFGADEIGVAGVLNGLFRLSGGWKFADSRADVGAECGARDNGPANVFGACVRVVVAGT